MKEERWHEKQAEKMIWKWKDKRTINGQRIYYGKMPLLDMLFHYIFRLDIVRWWVGTDSDTLVKTPVGDWRWRKIRLPLHRLKARITESFVKEHWAGCDNVKNNLLHFGINAEKILMKSYPPLYPDPVDRSKLIVILHIPKNFKKNFAYKRWYHGIDIAEDLMNRYSDAYWLIADNTQDMKAFYAVADCCVITKRAVGVPRMLQECQLNGIPIYYGADGVNMIDILYFLKMEHDKKIRARNRVHE